MQECDQDGFQSQRGCRKHVNTKQSWFFYFDEKPNSKEITDSLRVASNVPKANTIQDQTSESNDMPESYFSHFYYRVTLAKYSRDG